MEANWAVYIAGFAAAAAFISSLADVFGLRFHRMGAQGTLASASAGLVSELRLQLTTVQRDLNGLERDALKNEKIWDKRLEEETEARKALENTLDASQKAWNKERAEMQKRIGEQDTRIKELETALKERDEVIAALRKRIEELEAEKERLSKAKEGEKPEGDK